MKLRRSPLSSLYALPPFRTPSPALRASLQEDLFLEKCIFASGYPFSGVYPFRGHLQCKWGSNCAVTTNRKGRGDPPEKELFGKPSESP